MQFVSLTQPINSLAFVFDGLHYGASDFAYAALSMVSTHSPDMKASEDVVCSLRTF